MKKPRKAKIQQVTTITPDPTPIAITIRGKKVTDVKPIVYQKIDLNQN